MTTAMPHRRPPRLEDAVYTGAAHVFLTMCTFKRRTHFACGDVVNLVRRELLQTAEQYLVEVIAYCFMPDHLHALVAGTSEQTNLKKFFTVFRQKAAYRYRQVHPQPLWQDGFYDRALRAEDAIFDVASYILANPIEAGLAADAISYPYSGSSRYSLEDISTSITWRPDSLGFVRLALG
jgi:putative transposase